MSCADELQLALIGGCNGCYPAPGSVTQLSLDYPRYRNPCSNSFNLLKVKMLCTYLNDIGHYMIF